MAGRGVVSAVVFLSSVIGSGVAAAQNAPESLEDLKRGFQNPPENAKIMVRWWWFGPAVTKAGLERELRQMKAAGIGGVEIQPVYPLSLDDPERGVRNLPYLSGEFIEALRFAVETARKLGLRVDLTLGSGWPFGGPHIPITHAAGRLRIEQVRVADGSRRAAIPDIGAGERLIAAFSVEKKNGAVVKESVREMQERRDGAFWLPAAGRGRVAVFFISSRTGMMVKRASVGAEGFVLDHYDRAAMELHLKAVGDRLMEAFGAHPPEAVFCDSLESFGSDWTPDFPEEFLKRRGYDIRPRLPALAFDFGEETRKIRRDWGRTLAELANERFLAPLREWAHRHGTATRVQGYGTPPVELSSYALTDLPEGEGVEWRALSSARWATSAAHLYDKPVISSETWTWLHSPSFRATPLDLKAEADLHFLQGVNQLVGHGWPYSPESAGYPGWRFYAATALNEKNPWWIAAPDMTLYFQRVSWLLRQGRPVNDVAIYLSNEDGWARMTPGDVNLFHAHRDALDPALPAAALDAGYGFDFADDAAIGKLGRYRAVIAASGAAKLAGVPNVIPWRGDAAALAAALAKAAPPDVTLSPAAPEIGFVHRTAPAAEIYFLANTGPAARTVQAAFRVSGLEPEWWDPLTGETRRAEVTSRTASSVTVSMDLAPYGSRVLAFSRRRSTAPREPRVEAASAAIEGWSVSFGRKTAPMAKLRSWTEDEETRYFSGVAVYNAKAAIPDALLAPGLEVRLDFGEPRMLPVGGPGVRMQAWLEAPVREAAVVYVNGRRAGAVWCAPYSVNVTGLLRQGENEFRIEVGNLAINALAGMGKPYFRLLNLRYGERFVNQDANNPQPAPSGLLGRIRLAGLK